MPFFTGCESEEFTPLNYVTFETGPIEVPEDLNGSTTREITVYTGNITGADRTFNINVGGTLDAAAHNVPETITVPGGTNEVSFTLDVADVGIDPEGDKLILSIAPGAD